MRIELTLRGHIWYWNITVIGSGCYFRDYILQNSYWQGKAHINPDCYWMVLE